MCCFFFPTRPPSPVPVVTDDYTLDRTREYSDVGEFDLLEPVGINFAVFVLVLTATLRQVNSLPERKDGVRGRPVTLTELRHYLPSANAPVVEEHKFREVVFRGGLNSESRKEAWMYFLRHRW